MATKPFRPEEAQRILQILDRPAVFLNMTDDWPGRNWTLEHLASCLEKSLRFRIGTHCEQKKPLYETECSYVEATFTEFLNWTRGGSDSASVGHFAHCPVSEYWAYADYKYIALLFQDKPSMFKDVLWSDFGYPGRDGRESTIWVGTNGANTPCHQDTYGCNLVFQIQGRKRWHLFPPDDADCLYPTRIPYEESSVFSQVLFVPRHWWHYVESVDPVTISVNSWIEMESDDEARIGEALTKTIICALKTTPSLDNKDSWLNPTEDNISPHDENMQYLNLALKAYMDKRSAHAEDGVRCEDQLGTSSSKRDSSGQLKTSIPFGPHLIPVMCSAEMSHKHSATNNKKTLLGEDDAPLTPNKTKPLPVDTLEKEEVLRGSQKPIDNEIGGAKQERILTNDVLDCLLHPDVIGMVRRLMINRVKESNSEQIADS
ncbi:HSPB1-associated protein 1 homolog isoform X2 [Trichomycterus rosablanca]|uniref:HSPB1-associated protein 1 homolog isoform X2 n=1 Tax=Trichomycterus rosablanca TaxID=2290929 RepID=UPI002F350B3A